MKCLFCHVNEAPPDWYCSECEPAMREAFVLLFAGLADLFRAEREQEAKEIRDAA